MQSAVQMFGIAQPFCRFHLGPLLMLLFNLRAERPGVANGAGRLLFLPSAFLPPPSTCQGRVKFPSQGKGGRVGGAEVLFIAGGMNREEIGGGGKMSATVRL